MKQLLLNAGRWLRQAEYDLQQARNSLSDGSFAYAAFFSEQAAQKALKAYLFSSGRRAIAIHSVAELAREAGRQEEAFAALVSGGAQLDRHYLASRYPDALPTPAAPFESYFQRDAEEAIAIAAECLRVAKLFIG